MKFKEKLYALLGKKIPFSADFIQEALDVMMDREYLETISSRDEFLSPPMARNRLVEWIRLDRLPVNPTDFERYDLLSRWQSVLSSLHTWNKQTVFLLKRENGESRIHLGIVSQRSHSEVHRLESALRNCMPGIMFTTLEAEQGNALRDDLLAYDCAGAVTGIPSFRQKKNFNILQTLDQLAFGIRDTEGDDANFAMLVVANPITDDEIVDSISRMRKLGSDIHTLVSWQEGSKAGGGIAAGALKPLIGTLIGFIPGAQIIGSLGDFAANVLSGIAVGAFAEMEKTKTVNHLDKTAQYAEQLTDKHCQRLLQGRSLGFWNTGVYVMASSYNDSMTVLGMLRSIYSGDETYIEPIRVHTLHGNGIDIARRFELIPLRGTWESAKELSREVPEGEPWHIFGEPFQYVSTPMNTEELSLATSLPRKDVPGLRFVKNAVRFANNPGDVAGDDVFSLGHIKDTGIIQAATYRMSVDSLVRHALVAGGTGCGKTTTCKKIMGEVSRRGIPILIVEPAKDEWVQWAAERKRNGEDVNIFMPGVREIYGVRTLSLKLNPFAPAGIEGAPVDALMRCEQFTSIVNASLPMGDVLPVLIDEAFYVYLKKELGHEFVGGEMKPREEWPMLEGVLPIAEALLKERGYDERVERGLLAALETRFAYLTRGKRGEVLNVRRCTPWTDLFEKPAVINLSRLGNANDRSLVMSTLLSALQEYRTSAYMNDEAYRLDQTKRNHLRHLTVIEEAHNVLRNPEGAGGGDAKRVVADMFGNMLSEIRSYGEGLMILDQVPTRLIPDVVKNTNYKIAHRMSSPDDCSVMESALALRGDQRGILPTLTQGEVIVLGDHDDAASWVKVEKESNSHADGKNN